MTNDQHDWLAWFMTGLNDEAAAYLHGLGHHPNPQHMSAHLTAAKQRTPYGPDFAHAANRRAALTLAHPHLTPNDIDLLLRTRLTLTEAHHQITPTGLRDPDTLHVLAALH